MLFSTTQANRYVVAPISEDYVTTGFYNVTLLHNMTDYEVQYLLDTVSGVLHAPYQESNFETLSPQQCLKAYSTQYVASRGDVLVVQKELISQTEIWVKNATDEPVSDTFGRWSQEYISSPYQPPSDQGTMVPALKPLPYVSEPLQYPSYNWQCTPRFNKTCSFNWPGEGKQFSWSPYGHKVLYCLSEKVREECKLNYSLQFALIVVISNLAKVICMFLTVWRHRDSALITIGDAIQSFLDRPDPLTRGFCIYSDHHIELFIRNNRHRDVSLSAFSPTILKSVPVNNHTLETFLENQSIINGVSDRDAGGVLFLLDAGSCAACCESAHQFHAKVLVLV